MIGQEFSYPIQQSIYIADGIDNIGLYIFGYTLYFSFLYLLLSSSSSVVYYKVSFLAGTVLIRIASGIRATLRIILRKYL